MYPKRIREGFLQFLFTAFVVLVGGLIVKYMPAKKDRREPQNIPGNSVVLYESPKSPYKTDQSR